MDFMFKSTWESSNACNHQQDIPCVKASPTTAEHSTIDHKLHEWRKQRWNLINNTGRRTRGEAARKGLTRPWDCLLRTGWCQPAVQYKMLPPGLDLLINKGFNNQAISTIQIQLVVTLVISQTSAHPKKILGITSKLLPIHLGYISTYECLGVFTSYIRGCTASRLTRCQYSLGS